MVRNDLQHLIIDTGRYHCDDEPRVHDDDMDAQHAPMRNRHGRYPGDRTAPLFRYLRKQVGRPWNVVHSELSRAFDKRSLRGYHLHSHIDNILMIDNVIKTAKGYRHRAPRHTSDGLFRDYELFVDEHGLLRRPRSHEMSTRAKERARRRARAAALEGQRLATAEGVYLLVDGLWWFVVPGDEAFRAAAAGHEKVALFDTDSLTFRWRPVTEIGRFDQRTWYLPRSKRQVSRREINKEGLER